MAPSESIDELCVNTIRTLCIDAVQQANSGHPGTPMAMAPRGRISCALTPLTRSGPTATLGRERYTGLRGTIIGMKTFGASAPLKELLVKFGFTPEHVYAAAKEQLAGKE